MSLNFKYLVIITALLLVLPVVGFSAPFSVNMSVFSETDGSVIPSWTVDFRNTSFNASFGNENNPFDKDNTALPFGLIDIIISKTGYETRSFNDVLTITATSSYNRTFLIPETGSTTLINFHVKDQKDQNIQGALVQAFRTIGGVVDGLAGSGLSDSSGTVSLNLNESYTYLIQASAGGYTALDGNTISNSTITPTQTDYTITLVDVSTLLNFSAFFQDVQFEYNPDYPLTNFTTNQTFSFFVNSSNSSLNHWGFNISHQNGTQLCGFNSTSVTGGTGYCFLNLEGMNETMNSTLFINKNGYSETWTMNKTHYIFDYNELNNTFYNTFIDMSNDTDFGAIILPLIALIISGLAGALASGVGGTFAGINKAGVGWLSTLIFLGMFTFAGWFNSFLFIFISIVVVAITFLEWRGSA